MLVIHVIVRRLQVVNIAKLVCVVLFLIYGFHIRNIINSNVSFFHHIAATSDNLLQHFINREYTCGCLRMSDVNKSVSLVGWVDGKRAGKFIQLHDGYGQTQIIIDSDQLKKQMVDVTDIDIILVKGRVVARPHTHKTLVS